MWYTGTGDQHHLAWKQQTSLSGYPAKHGHTLTVMDDHSSSHGRSLPPIVS